MKNTIHTISQFKELLLFRSIIDIVFIVAFIVILLCIKKRVPVNSIIGKIRLIIWLLLVILCINFFRLIPSYIDVYTDNIKVMEISEYSCRYNRGGVLNPGGPTIDFTAESGKHMLGYLVDDFEIPSSGHGYILYAKFSHYILDCDLRE